MSDQKDSEASHIKVVSDFSPDSKSEELKLLEKVPVYVCEVCGRSAAMNENLCQSQRLYSTW